MPKLPPKSEPWTTREKLRVVGSILGLLSIFVIAECARRNRW